MGKGLQGVSNVIPLPLPLHTPAIHYQFLTLDLVQNVRATAAAT